jgi:undecaprenyl-phosphate 4-deoxy-4-formamido-L-arabinose transferase
MTAHPAEPTLSVVIPLYRSAESIAQVVAGLARLEVEGGLEIVLVNDDSPDDTLAVCQHILATCPAPVTIVSLARNFGEHNAVLTGLRQSRGRWAVTMDDDGQNPPSEALKLLETAQRGGYDAVFGQYEVKQHAVWRNWGSRFANGVAGWVLGKPPGLYLSSFRCLSRFLIGEIIRYEGPYPYIDGLILQCTRNLASTPVEHRAREAGSSGYTLRKLVRLWMNMFVNFSVLPLRLATALGLGMAALGFAGLAVVLGLYLSQRGPAFGWGSLMAALLMFSGAQMVMLGLIGEYLGRTYLHSNRRPQTVVREVRRGGRAPGGEGPRESAEAGA